MPTPRLHVCRLGMYIYLCMPAVAQMQWHPISLAGSPSANSLAVLVSASGAFVAPRQPMNEPSCHVCEINVHKQNAGIGRPCQASRQPHADDQSPAVTWTTAWNVSAFCSDWQATGRKRCTSCCGDS
jgi:FAD-binding domain